MLINTVIDLIPFNRIVLSIGEEERPITGISPWWEMEQFPVRKDQNVIVVKDIPEVIQPESLTTHFFPI